VKFEVDIEVYEQGKKRPEYTLDSDLHGEISLTDLLKWTKTSLIVIADEVLKQEQSAGFDAKPILLVDGKRGRSVLDVSPLGSIEFVARQAFGDILLEAYNGLLRRSKVLTGRYKASHYVFFNGIQVATDLDSLRSWVNSSPTFKNKDTVRIVNIQPYGRRLELLGVTAQRSKPKLDEAGRRSGKRSGKFFKVPNGAYVLTTRSLRAKYKQNALIRFSFLPGSSLGLAGTFKSGRRGKNSAGRPYLYPTIVFTITERGLL